MERHGSGFARTPLRARAGLGLAVLALTLVFLTLAGRSGAEVLSADQIHKLDSKGVPFVDGARILAVEQLGPKPQVTPQEIQLELGPTGLPPASAGTNGSFQPHTPAERKQILAKLRRGGAPARSVGKAYATWYGPTLYGNGVACGGTLTPNTIGVAHKTLPCGTELVIGYNGHWERAKVIDRGPYGTGAQYDLTEALAERLGFISTGFGEIQVAKVG